MKRKIIYMLIMATLVVAMVGCGAKEPTPVSEPASTQPAPTDTAIAQNPSTPVSAATATPQAAAPTATAMPASTSPATPGATAAPAGASPTVAAPTATAVSTASPTPAVPVAAIVNGQAIPLEEYQRQVKLAESSFAKQGGMASDQETLRQVRQQVLDWLIDQVLIEQTAQRMGITISDAAINAELAKARGDDAAKFAKWLEENGLTEDSFRANLRSELLGAAVRDAVTAYIPDKMEQVHLRHILVASEQEARQILSQIRTNDDFVRLAKLNSIDLGTRESGGDLGFYPRGVLSPEIDRVAFNIVVGQISDVIQTGFGYHIIQVLERDPARAVTPEMMLALRQEAFMSWLEAERARAQIEYLQQ